MANATTIITDDMVLGTGVDHQDKCNEGLKDLVGITLDKAGASFGSGTRFGTFTNIAGADNQPINTILHAIDDKLGTITSNFANADLTLTGARSHDGATFDLTITNLGDLTFSAATFLQQVSGQNAFGFSATRQMQLHAYLGSAMDSTWPPPKSLAVDATGLVTTVDDPVVGIKDDLNSPDTDHALTANQGKILAEIIGHTVGNNHMGGYSGTTVVSNRPLKTNVQDLETAVENRVITGVNVGGATPLLANTPKSGSNLQLRSLESSDGSINVATNGDNKVNITVNVDFSRFRGGYDLTAHSNAYPTPATSTNFTGQSIVAGDYWISAADGTFTGTPAKSVLANDLIIANINDATDPDDFTISNGAATAANSHMMNADLTNTLGARSHDGGGFNFTVTNLGAYVSSAASHDFQIGGSSHLLIDGSNLKFPQYTGTNMDGTPVKLLGVTGVGSVVTTDVQRDTHEFELLLLQDLPVNTPLTVTAASAYASRRVVGTSTDFDLSNWANNAAMDADGNLEILIDGAEVQKDNTQTASNVIVNRLSNTSVFFSKELYSGSRIRFRRRQQD